MEPVFITGMGAVSALGISLAENFNALKREQSGINPGSTSYSNGFLVGEVSATNEALSQKVGVENRYSRTSLLGMLAAQNAFENHAHFTEIRTGFISGTSVGGMDISETKYPAFLQGEHQKIADYQQHPSGTSSDDIARHLGITEYVNTVSTACSSATNAIALGARLIQAKLLDRVVVGGSDALCAFTIQGFNALHLLDKTRTRPFDRSRNGLNLGEAAAYLVLESKKSLKWTKKHAVAQLSAWSNACDAYHQTASSPDGKGATIAMKNALEMSGLAPSEIDYINAHGTGTPNNDLTESMALKSVFGSKIPPFSSTKAYTGHTLGASGALEAIFSIFALRESCLFPNLHFQQPLEETNLVPIQQLKSDISIKHVLSNAFGFGGNCSTLIFSKADESLYL